MIYSIGIYMVMCEVCHWEGENIYLCNAVLCCKDIQSIILSGQRTDLCNARMGKRIQRFSFAEYKMRMCLAWWHIHAYKQIHRTCVRKFICIEISVEKKDKNFTTYILYMEIKMQPSYSRKHSHTHTHTSRAYVTIPFSHFVSIQNSVYVFECIRTSLHFRNN